MVGVSIEDFIVFEEERTFPLVWQTKATVLTEPTASSNFSIQYILELYNVFNTRSISTFTSAKGAETRVMGQVCAALYRLKHWQ